jgi:hypothetical protein
LIAQNGQSAIFDCKLQRFGNFSENKFSIAKIKFRGTKIASGECRPQTFDMKLAPCTELSFQKFDL